MSGVTLSSSTIGIGGVTQGTVTVATAPATAASVTLTSSNPAVASVPSPITIPAGASTATFTITGMAAGTASVMASLNGSSSQSPSLTVARVAVSTITVSASTVVGGETVTGTVGLTASAPVGGAVVAISGTDPLIVPDTVTVAAGAVSATFSVRTRLVGGTIPGTVTASYGGGSASATVSVTKPTVATASFGITGPTESDTCTMTNGGNTLNCTFNGSTSTAPGNIVAWDWSYRAGTMAPMTQTTSSAILTMPAVSCGWLPAPPLAAGANPWLPLIVTLKVHDDLGNVSAEFSNNGGARVFPQGVCGY
jgi:trimeric autotransporter adhesin